MELGLALTALSGTPIQLDRHQAQLLGVYAPLIIPLACLPPAQRARWMLPRADLPIDDRVEAALEAGLTDDAWRVVIATPTALTTTGRLDRILGLWGARELARLELANPGSGTLIVADKAPPRLDNDAANALATVHEMLAPLAWPRWSGPILVVVGDGGGHDPAPGRDELVRPVLPMIRYVPPPATLTPAEYLSARFCLLTLDLTAPPAHGWPAWLRVGLSEVAKAKTRGEGPSPLRMLAIRQKAGKDALVQLLTAAKPDPQLALALCAPLVHTRWRPLLPNLLDSLRNGIEPEGALRLSYDLTIDQLLEER